jgi:hypothetical protein
MNYTQLDDAFRIHHTNPQIFNKKLNYSSKCIYCNNNESISLINDGGCFRRCVKCRKEFRATILSEPVENIVNSTRHLRGTN